MAPPPKEFNPRKTLLLALFLIAFGVYTYTRPAPNARVPPAAGGDTLTGETMGTTYTVTLTPPALTADALAALHAEIDDCLRNVNREMSTYDPGSEISRFNALISTNVFAVSPGFLRVATFALALGERTGGAFDPTLGPLIELWGFGRSAARLAPPDDEAIAAARAATGYRHLHLAAEGGLRKDLPALALDLSAVAKGFAVDRVAEVVRAHGRRHAFIEIGGEVVALGRKSAERPWRFGIDVPRPGTLPGEKFQAVVEIEDAALATSGDYRNFFRSQGRTYSHIIDPRSGRPTTHNLASVSVVAADCMTADGYATALLAMGEDEGRALVEAQPGVEALFIIRENDDGFREWQSPGFAQLRVDE